MAIDFKEITDQKIWDQFVLGQDFYTFLNSWQWGEFQKISGSEIERLGAWSDNRLVAVILLIKVTAKRGTFLFCPHGPLLVEDLNRDDFFHDFTIEVSIRARKKQATFVRLNSLLANTKKNTELLNHNGWKFAPIHMHAETTWLLDLTPSNEELLQKMRKTTRYLIKKGEKDGVTVKQDNSITGQEAFIKLHLRHAQENKHNYTAFTPEYIKNLFTVFKDDLSLKFSEFNGQVQAASIIIFYGKTCAYYLAASDSKERQFSTSYFLQWQSILEAKNRGCKTYNFWGVSPDDNKNHPIHGVSQFKKGFGGEQLDFLHAYDYPLTKWYYFNFILETLRRKKRGYYYLPPTD
jgi:lipid II:glycine glycyltransferase (peptidoglycan interpeptide bridge formation enzyme)